ncbi:hypothetical protein ANN_12822 [Periplaneta americana]|uniref:Uncharacterized protein n=1 Tax=Periplaneta americana TaxID=6978 RepID=A0ABQ8TKC8_PERAM|nr:hypothetical protein ANN_12822 [Periplaneta americana]
MAGLREGGIEPPGSLKASELNPCKTFYRNRISRFKLNRLVYATHDAYWMLEASNTWLGYAPAERDRFPATASQE